MHYGNYAVTVRTYRITRKDGSITSTPVINTPTFVMGGIAGQAMSANDVVNNVNDMFPSSDLRDMWINGNKAIEYLSATEEIYISLTPYE